MAQKLNAHYDLLFIAAVVVTVVCFVLSLITAVVIRRARNPHRPLYYYFLAVPYTAYVTLVSVFPLLGMLGTVTALLCMDLGSPTMDESFLLALRTTMWGILCAVGGKLVNAAVQPFFEEQIAVSRPSARRRNGGLSREKRS